MKRYFGFGIIFISMHSLALGFSQMVGDYAVSDCSGPSLKSDINYCDYNQVKISMIASDDSLTEFTFLKDGQKPLSFTLKAEDSSTDVFHLNEEQKASLSSQEGGVSSQISMEPVGSHERLELSSQGDGLTYKFVLILTSE